MDEKDEIISLEDIRSRPPELRYPQPETSPATDEEFTLEDMAAMGIQDRTVRPSYADYAEAASTGFARGATESGILLGSTLAGGRLGTLAAPFTGPAAPFMPAIGTAGGFLFGLHASDLAGRYFPEASREDLKSVYEGSRTFASGLAFSPSAFFFRQAPQGSNAIRQTIGAIGEFARNNPKKYLVGEGVASFYAGLFGGIAVETAPSYEGFLNPELVRLGAETAGGFAPTRMVTQLGTTLSNSLAKVFSTGYTDSTKNYVQQQLLNIAQSTGEDPKALVANLREGLANLPKSETGAVVVPTSAQLTGSPFLTSLEKTLARKNAKFSADSEKKGLEAMQAYKLAIRELEATGDPSMLQVAGELRKEFYANQFQTAFNAAQTEAVLQASRLGESGSDNRAAIGRILQGEVEGFLRIARETESELWQKAVLAAYRRTPGSEALRPVQVSPTSFTEALYDVVAAPRGTTSLGVVQSELAPFAKDLKRLGVNKKLFKQFDEVPITEEFLATGKLPPEVLQSLDIKDVSVMDLFRLRSGFLESARKAASTNDFASAARYNRLAGAILEDLDKLESPAYADARQYSKTLNDAFTRTFTAKVTGVNRQGADVYSPEVLVKRAFGAGADTTLQRMKEIEAAADFVDPTGAAALSVRDAHRKVFRALAAEGLQDDGTLRPAALETFRLKHADALEYLGLQNEFKDVASAQRALLDVKDPDSLLNRRINEEQAFAKLLAADDPVTAVSTALTNSEAPVKSFKSLVDIASSPADPAQREAARKGLSATIYQYAYQTADKGDQGFNADVFSDIFFKPFSPNTPSLANLMRSSDLMSAQELENLKKITGRMKNVQKTMTARASALDPEQVQKPADAIDQLAVAMIGAKFAGAISPGGPGSLSFAQRTIAMTQNLFNGMPAQQRLLLLQEAAQDPVLLEQLMSRVVTEEENRRIGLSVLRRFYSPAVFPTAVDRYVDTFLVPEEEEPPATLRQGQAAGMLRQMPPAPVTRGTPNLQLPTAQGPAQAAQAQQPPGQAPAAPTGGQSRQMLQRLFPYDATLQAAPMGQ